MGSVCIAPPCKLKRARIPLCLQAQSVGASKCGCKHEAWLQAQSVAASTKRGCKRAHRLALPPRL